MQITIDTNKIATATGKAAKATGYTVVGLGLIAAAKLQKAAEAVVDTVKTANAVGEVVIAEAKAKKPAATTETA